MSDLKLLPCPFCGSAAEMNYHKSTESYYVACSECTAHTCYHGAEQHEAAATWNTRTEPEATAPAQDLSAAIPEGWQLVPKTRDVAPNVFDKMILGAMKAFADPGYSPSKWDGNHGALVRYIIEGAARHQEHWPESIPAAALASSANALSAAILPKPVHFTEKGAPLYTQGQLEDCIKNAGGNHD